MKRIETVIPRTVMRKNVIRAGRAALLALALFAGAAPVAQGAAAADRELTVDQFSVVKISVKTVPDARSARTLGPQREGTGVVIDSSGLVLTIGYLVTEADTVELATADGRRFPANVVGYDNVTGLGLVKALKPLPIKPVDFGESFAPLVDVLGDRCGADEADRGDDADQPLHRRQARGHGDEWAPRAGL